MKIRQLKLKNFRCFQDSVFDFKNNIVVVEGNNGTGKTTLFEALYYACFLRSFRTSLSSDITNFQKDHFFVAVSFEEGESNICKQIQVGFSEGEKLVKLNGSSINSYKAIMEHYQILSITEEDLELIKGSPEGRRRFLNQALVLESPDFIIKLKNYRKALNIRNSFLFNLKNLDSKSLEELSVWSKQLWKYAFDIKQAREIYLQEIETKINNCLVRHFISDFSVKFQYAAKSNYLSSFDIFWKSYKLKNLDEEFKFRRSLFGIHLDDFLIDFCGKGAKFYASRGQQKLLLFLIKIAQLELLINKSKNVVLLFDDFLTDFDFSVLRKCLFILNDLKIQVFLSCPFKTREIFEKIPDFKAQFICL